MRRATDALRLLAARGETITYARVAKTANVSRAWLYNQPELRAQIERHRQPTIPNRAQEPKGQPATTESLRQQLHAYREEITRLRAENRALTDQLARHLGTQRTDNITRR